MSVPGVGPITALAFGGDRRSASFGSRPGCWFYLGLTPKRYQSEGTETISLSISRQGDEMVRHYLYEAANCLLTTVTGASAFKSWGLKISGQALAELTGPPRVARKLALLLLRL